MASERPIPPLETDPGLAEKLQDLLAVLAAVLSALLALFGIAALGMAILAAWTLYRDPGSIAPYAAHFARAVPAEAQGLEGLAELVAWVFVVLILLVLGKLGSWAVGAAGQLVRSRGRV